jgi:ParB-like chromosome segregation protein Spo0J
VTSTVLAAHPLADVFPLLPEPLLRELADDIAANGLLEPITLYEDKILDGRNRYAACSPAGVVPRFARFSGTLKDAAAFVRSKNLQRRDLEPAQRVAAILKMEELLGQYRAEAREAQGARTDLRLPGDGGSRDVLAQVAAVAGVGRGTAARVERVRREAPDLFERVATGEMAAKRADRVVRERQAAARAAEVLERALLPTSVDLREGAFQDVLAGVRDVDLVFTDPPYPREFLPLWSDLSAWAAQALKPGKLLVAYSGQYHLPEVLRRLEEHLEYVWVGSLATPGPHNQVQRRHVHSVCKPILFFARAPYEPGPWFQDSYGAGRRERDPEQRLHVWEQDIAAARYYIEALTEPGALVADPFLGSGTFALAAKQLGRSVVGAEIDPTAYATTVTRLAEAT